ncbi:MAG TPA: prepilin-type N-terminal cleavage/methylation domain-containing protein [Candidatus Angelobacter sp.]
MTQYRLFRKSTAKARSRGFSLVEVLLVILLLGVVCGVIYRQMAVVQQRARTEQVKLDYLQESRDFVDQFFRDINQVGYPSSRMVDQTAAWVPALKKPPMNDPRIATGLVRAGDNEIWFEGDMFATGTVQSVVYMVNGDGKCPLCLQRSQVDKQNGGPLGQNPVWGTEVNDVATNVIFTYFDTNGNKVATPVDINTNPDIMATIKTVQINLRITNPAVIDQKTGQPIEMAFQGEVSINNCSSAAILKSMSCL